ncbi:MAG: hypothetical protein AB7Q16_03380 [Vicinamibacterales bacterium]
MKVEVTTGGQLQQDQVARRRHPDGDAEYGHRLGPRDQLVLVIVAAAPVDVDGESGVAARRHRVCANEGVGDASGVEDAGDRFNRHRHPRRPMVDGRSDGSP